jgi:hypothetical protein
MTVEARTKLMTVAWAGLVVAGLHLLALGSFHNHDQTRSLEVAAPHLCFLCQVSPNVEVTEGVDETGTDQPLVVVPLLSPTCTHPAPLLATGSARAPPA